MLDTHLLFQIMATFSGSFSGSKVVGKSLKCAAASRKIFNSRQRIHRNRDSEPRFPSRLKFWAALRPANSVWNSTMIPLPVNDALPVITPTLPPLLLHLSLAANVSQQSMYILLSGSPGADNPTNCCWGSIAPCLAGSQKPRTRLQI